MSAFPTEHITDAHKLVADGVVELFQLSPPTGGTLYFKNDNDVTWQGNTYTGLPVSLTGLEDSAQGGSMQPKMIIGELNRDLSVFKPLVNDGHLEGALLTYIRVLRDHVISNANIKKLDFFTVQKVAGYSRAQVSLQLSRSSDNARFTIPHRQILPPGFPAVLIQ